MCERKTYFISKEEAEEYRASHKLYARKAEYLPCVDRWALVFDIRSNRPNREVIQCERQSASSCE